MKVSRVGKRWQIAAASTHSRSHAQFHADNPFAIAAPGAKGEVGYVLVHQPKSFDWRQRNARPHPWGTGHTKLLDVALKRFNTVFNVGKTC